LSEVRAAGPRPALCRQPPPSLTVAATAVSRQPAATAQPAAAAAATAAVDRIVCKGETYETDVFVDVASEEYRLRVGDKFTMTLTSTLNLDGTPDADEYVPDGKPNLLDDYEYGMCGKVFKYEYLSDKRVAAVASFGGLLLLIQGEQRHLVRIQLDQKLYCLLRKASK